MRKRQVQEGQALLFDLAPRRPPPPARGAAAPAKSDAKQASRWRMPELQGRTVAEIRLRWSKRLTPAQVARVEAELNALPQALARLGFGTVQVERAFVRRRRGV